MAGNRVVEQASAYFDQRFHESQEPRCFFDAERKVQILNGLSGRAFPRLSMALTTTQRPGGGIGNHADVAEVGVRDRVEVGDVSGFIEADERLVARRAFDKCRPRSRRTS